MYPECSPAYLERFHFCFVFACLLVMRPPLGPKLPHCAPRPPLRRVRLDHTRAVTLVKRSYPSKVDQTLLLNPGNPQVPGSILAVAAFFLLLNAAVLAVLCRIHGRDLRTYNMHPLSLREPQAVVSPPRRSPLVLKYHY